MTDSQSVSTPRHLSAAGAGRSGRSDLSQRISDEGPGLGDRLLYTRKEAAHRLSLSLSEIDYARRRGDLAAHRYGSKILIHADELRRFAESLPPDQD